MIAYRIADSRHPVFDGTGAGLHGARWNSPGLPVIYAAETYAGALLEILVHANLSRPPKHLQVVRITIPDDLACETLSSNAIEQWDGEDVTSCRAFGDRWIRDRRTAVLRVPSVITRDRERNVLLNPAHPDFGRIHAQDPEPVFWDMRLFPKYDPK